MPTKFYSALQVHEASVMYYYIHSFASFSCALMDSAAVEVYFLNNSNANAISGHHAS